MQKFESIIEFVQHFSTDAICREHLEQSRWNGTPRCPFCDSTNVHRHPNSKRFNCRVKGCRKIFTATVGTIYENSNIPLNKWYLAVYILTVHSKGISSKQLVRYVKVTQKTAWFMTHRIREMFIERNPEPLEGIVEVDETMCGGSDKFRHEHKKKGIAGKTILIGALARGGKITTRILPNAKKEHIEGFVLDTLHSNSKLITDEASAYQKVGKDFNHESVNHKAKEYVRKDDKSIHTNTIEGFWSLLKRQVKGIHHSISPKHYQRYAIENCYRYNYRALEQHDIFEKAIANCEGRLTYNRLKSDISYDNQ